MSRKSSSKKSKAAKNPTVNEGPTLSNAPDGNADFGVASESRTSADSGTLKHRFSFYVLLAVVLGIALLSFRVMKGFILPLFLAALLVVIFQPIHSWLLERFKGRKGLAAGLTTTAILLIVLAPIGWALTVGIVEGVSVSSQWGKNADLLKIDKKLDPTRQTFGLEIPLEDDLDDVLASITALKIPTATANHAQRVAGMRPNIDNFASEFQQLIDNLDSSLEVKQKLVSELARDDLSEEERAQFQVELESLKWTERIVDREDPSAVDARWSELKADVASLQALEREFADSPTAKQVDSYESLVDEINVSYQLARQEMLGGAGWATLTELVNPSEMQIQSLQKQAQELLQSLLLKFTGKTTSIMGSLAMQIFILSIAIFYFLMDGPEMVNAAMHLSPMDDRYEREMITEFARLSRAVVVATLLSALAQGLLAGVGYFFCWQFESLFMLVILTTLLAMVPFVGAAAVWIPCCVYLAFVENRYLAAGLLAAYGFFIVSMADNIIKPMVLKGQSNLHPLFALLSVLGGVQALGPVGVLIGPMLLAFLQTLLKLLNRDLDLGSTAPQAGGRAQTPT